MPGCRACTNAARIGAPSGPDTVPEIVAAPTGDVARLIDPRLTDPSNPRRTNDRIAFPRVCDERDAADAPVGCGIRAKRPKRWRFAPRGPQLAFSNTFRAGGPLVVGGASRRP